MAINFTEPDTTGYRTLLQLRTDLFADLGYAAIAANPPPGMAAYLNLKLRQAHELLWHRFPALRTLRWYSWPLTAGERFYSLTGNAEQSVSPVSTKLLDPYEIRAVEVQFDTTGYRQALIHGIPSRIIDTTSSGRPSHYAVNQGIELWPAPTATEGMLLVQGRFKATAFTADTDQSGIDDQMVYLLALANAKAHYRQPDANNYVQQMENLIDNLVAGTHATARYIPGDNRRELIYTMPVPTVPFL